ncbi:type II toxin-antitoxin system RelE/ParE family toxin [Nocardia tengchongensis]|uniref:type II toxin-antitoxin system RelE/ParE family toxin n=1 Tax=Nocardia tengchongensis TaxID=2055889 RepID=UPI00361812CB
MSRYLLSPAAAADIDEIWDYTHDRWDADQADEYIREIQRAIERAAAHPHIGRSCDDIRPGYFKIAAGSHVAFYRVTADAIIIVRILHQRMDVDRHL